MIAYLSQSFIFESAHTLHRQVPLVEFEPSMRVHGHTYTAEITFSGEVCQEGMIQVERKGRKKEPLDLFLVRKIIGEVKLLLDHRMLDNIPNLGTPTLENLCIFIGSFAGFNDLPLHRVCISRATGDKCEIFWGTKQCENPSKP